MAITASGAVSFADINTEFGRSLTASISFNDTRTHYMSSGTSSGQADFNGFHGKVANLTVTINSNQTGYNLASSTASSSYNPVWQALSVVVNSGVTIYGLGGDANAGPGGTGILFNATQFGASSFPYGVTLTNNGTIYGGGGNGGSGGSSYNDGMPGNSGGDGIRAQGTGMSVTVINNGTIGGGGAGGGGGLGTSYPAGGGGGGAPNGGGGYSYAGPSGYGQASTTTTGGAGGAPASSNAGGQGGNLASNGSNGGGGGLGTGGIAGYASRGISGGSFTWSTVGTRVGTVA
jgi:hypothetical protein